MSFERWGYTFEGAWSDPNQLESRSGVYVIWCRNGEAWSVLDVGESHDVRGRILAHDRMTDWKRHCNGVIYYSATYTPDLHQTGRILIEQKIRSAAKPPCGKE
jgi:hypothetical protein